MTDNEIRDKTEKQALEIVKDLKDTSKIFAEHDKQIIALIAYLQKLGMSTEVEGGADEGPPPMLKPGIPDTFREPKVSAR